MAEPGFWEGLISSADPRGQIRGLLDAITADPRARKSFELEEGPPGTMGRVAGGTGLGPALRGIAQATPVVGSLLEAVGEPGSGTPYDWGKAAGKTAMGAAAIVPAGRVGGPIRGYHGSPYNFDRWDFGKIRSGEGSAMMGHGAYIATHEPVAQSYRAVAPSKPMTPEVREALRGMDNLGFDTARQALSNIERYPDWKDRWDVSQPVDAHRVKIIEDYMAANPRGHMYEVDVHADPERFIVAEKPLSEQPPLVQQALALRQTNTGIGGGPKLYSETTGMYVPDRPDLPANRVLNVHHPSSVAAIEKAGVPGMTYWDQGSRVAGSGTRNLVVFPTQAEIIEILRKYGLAPAAAGGALAGGGLLAPQPEAQ